jgi:ankyrin repeat protein
VRRLLDAGANTELRNYHGDTPLLLATKGHTAAVQLLLDKGADVEAKQDGKAPLFFAAEGGYDAIVKLLLEKGAVNQDPPGLTRRRCLLPLQKDILLSCRCCLRSVPALI